MKQKKILRLMESGLMLAVATALSMVKVLDLPYGGSITAFSALPLLLVAYRHGTLWGLLTAFGHAIIQLLLGMGTLSYATSAMAAVAILVLDYLLAFTVLGLGGVFRRVVPNQGTALILGALLTGVLRYVLHVIAGCTVWAGLSIPTEAALVYSLAYNATYMLPETLVTVLGAWYLSKAVNVQEDLPTRAKCTEQSKPRAFVVGLVGKAALLAAAVWDVVAIFRHLQDPDSGDFVIARLELVNWPAVAVVSVSGVLLWLLSELIRRRLNETKE